jgi:hypothetical protein
MFTLAAFAVLLALRVATAEPPASLASVLPNQQTEIYAGFYLGVAAGTAWLMVTVIGLAMLGAALSFSLLVRNRLPRKRVVFAAGAVCAVVIFFLESPATRLLGQGLWSIGVVALACLLGYVAGRVSPPNAA